MQTKIHLDETDRIHGSGKSIVIATEDTDVLAIFFPLDPEQTLKLCSEVVDAVENIRHAAYSAVRAG